MADFGNGVQEKNSGGHLAFGGISGKVTFTQTKCGKQGGVMVEAELEYPHRGIKPGSGYAFFIHEFGDIYGDYSSEIPTSCNLTSM